MRHYFETFITTICKSCKFKNIQFVEMTFFINLRKFYNDPLLIPNNDKKSLRQELTSEKLASGAVWSRMAYLLVSVSKTIF